MITENSLRMEEINKCSYLVFIMSHINCICIFRLIHLCGRKVRLFHYSTFLLYHLKISIWDFNTILKRVWFAHEKSLMSTSGLCARNVLHFSSTRTSGFLYLIWFAANIFPLSQTCTRFCQDGWDEWCICFPRRTPSSLKRDACYAILR